MLKGLFFVLLAGLIGLACGWYRFASQYQESAFGPFTLDNRAVQVSAAAAGGPASALPAVDSDGQLPRLEVVGGPEFNFGVMEPGAEGKHSFVVRNTGEAPLRLEVAGSTCKCTVGTLNDAVLEPGEQTDIELAWVATGLSEEFGQSARLKTNDPRLGELNLKIQGRIVSRMTMVPRHFTFGEVESGESIVLESTLFSFSKTPIQPVSQAFTDREIHQRAEFEVEEVSVASTGNSDYASAAQAFRLRVAIAPGLPLGPIQDQFQFKFAPRSMVSDDGQHEEELTSQFVADLSGRIVGVLTLVESRRVYNGSLGAIFSIGDVDPADGETFRANLMLRGPKRNQISLAIDRVEPAAVLRAELGEPVGRSSTVLIPLILSVAPDAPPTDLMGRGNDDYGLVVIKTDDPDESPLELKIRFRVPAR